MGKLGPHLLAQIQQDWSVSLKSAFYVGFLGNISFEEFEFEVLMIKKMVKNKMK